MYRYICKKKRKGVIFICSWRKGRLKDCLESTGGVEEGQARCTFFPDGN